MMFKMLRMALLALHLLITLSLVSSTPVPCPYDGCTCYRGVTLVQCSNLGLTTLPPLRQGPEYLQNELIISGNKIQSLEDGQLMHNLSELMILEDSLNHISDHAFIDSAESLRKLTIGHCNLNYLPFALLDLKHLTWLVWLDNPTYSFGTSVLRHLGTSLKTLEFEKMNLREFPSWLDLLPNLDIFAIEQSSITDIDGGVIRNYVKSDLKELKIRGCNLTAIPHAVENFPNLTNLDLTSNSIKSIDNLRTLKFPTNISDFSLHGNEISDISPISFTRNIKRIWLSHNKICDHIQFPDALDGHQHSLTWLELDSNCLTEIPDLHSMVKLGDIQLGFNNINDSTSGYFPTSARSIGLDYNKLSSIPPSISNLRHLYTLTISHNLITSFDNFTFPSSMVHLEIGGNKIEVINHFKFSANYTKLQNLDLMGNPLKSISVDAFKSIPNLANLILECHLPRLPLALKDLIHLKTAYLGHGYTCTCQEASLADWYNSLPALMLNGRCGSTDVTYFLGTMAANCP